VRDLAALPQPILDLIDGQLRLAPEQLHHSRLQFAEKRLSLPKFLREAPMSCANGL
jgi:hypothetical protein